LRDLRERLKRRRRLEKGVEVREMRLDSHDRGGIDQDLEIEGNETSTGHDRDRKMLAMKTGEMDSEIRRNREIDDDSITMTGTTATISAVLPHQRWTTNPS
jgi:hypothetical protein